MIRRPPRYTPTDTPFPYTARFRPNSQQVGTDAAAKVVNVEQVVAMVGPFCSGETLAAANTVNIPAGVVMLSPSATSPELTTLKDNDLVRSEEHTSELQSLMRISYAVFCLKKKTQ